MELGDPMEFRQSSRDAGFVNKLLGNFEAKVNDGKCIDLHDLVKDLISRFISENAIK